MQYKWPTENSDLEVAFSVLDRHVDLNGGEPVGIVEVVVGFDDEELSYDVSDWVKELAGIFCQKYGRERGEIVTKRVVSRCLTQGHTVH